MNTESDPNHHIELVSENNELGNANNNSPNPKPPLLESIYMNPRTKINDLNIFGYEEILYPIPREIPNSENSHAIEFVFISIGLELAFKAILGILLIAATGQLHWS